MTIFGFLLFAAAAIAPSGETFICTPTRVWDGDGPIWCAEGPRIRLSGIAAREMDGTCRPNHPCPKASAQQARDALVGLIGRPVECGYELPMSQEQLADALGLTPVHVNRTLKGLETEGLILRQNHQVSFPDWQRLREKGGLQPTLSSSSATTKLRLRNLLSFHCVTALPNEAAAGAQ